MARKDAMEKDERRQENGEDEMEEDNHEEAPEGGWGWLVALALALSKMAYWGAIPPFGIVFADVLQSDPKLTGSAVSSTLGALTICLSVVGIFCPALYKRGLSLRQVGVFGGFVFFIGTLSSVFVVTVPQLVFTFGVVQGLGFGMMLSATVVSFNLHFKRRRTWAMALPLVVSGAVTLALPLLAQALYAEYGPRAARACFACISFPTALSMWLLRSPPPRKRNSTPTIKIELRGDPCGTPDVASKERNNLLHEDTNVVCGGNSENAECNFPSARSVTKCGRNQSPKQKKNWLKRIILKTWDLSGLDASLLGDVYFVSVVVGLAVVHVTDAKFFVLLPLHMRAIHFSGDDVAHVVTAACAGDMAGRVILVPIGRFLANRNQMTFAFAAFVSSVCILVFSFLTDLTTLAALASILGICKGLIYTTYFLTLAEMVAPKKLPAAMAFLFLSMIIVSFIISPIVGLARDLTGSYPVCFRTLAVLLAICPFLWVPQMIRKAYQQRYHIPSSREESS